MWLRFIRERTAERFNSATPVAVVCRAKDGREFTPFSIEMEQRGPAAYVVLCEDEEEALTEQKRGSAAYVVLCEDEEEALTEHKRGSADWFRAESYRLGCDNWRGPMRLREAADRIAELEARLAGEER